MINKPTCPECSSENTKHWTELYHTCQAPQNEWRCEDCRHYFNWLEITRADVLAGTGNVELSLSKLTGKKIKDVLGYISDIGAGPTFTLTHIVFEDDTRVSVEGEHDFPYIYTYHTQPQPGLDKRTLQRLYDERE